MKCQQILKENNQGTSWLGHGGWATGGAAYILFRNDGALIVTGLTNLSISSKKMAQLLKNIARVWMPADPYLATI